METLALVAAPAAAGGAAFLIRRDAPRRALLALAAVAHAALVAWAWARPAPPAPGAWLGLDGPGRLFLTLCSGLFLAAAFYALHYLRRESGQRHTDEEEGFFFTNSPEARFTGCMLFFLATMSLVCASRNLGLLWVAAEGTTLASAPLIYFHRHHRSLEATWKYLLVCSVGIALALLGNYLLAAAAGEGADLSLDSLAQRGAAMKLPQLKAAFVLLLVGYGAKMGLAPLHTWLPDAHSEAPSLVSALLSGALLNCAFLGILRGQQTLIAAGQAAFGQDLLTLFGLLSMAVAAAFLAFQSDYKRMLAYSSVEHMGVLALGVGLGGAGVYGAMLHAVNHSAAKAAMFFLAGNILAVYRAKNAADVRGVARALPVTGALWIAGFLALCGSPPFGLFASELTILRAALGQGQGVAAALFLASLGVAFVGILNVALRMAQGPAPIERRREDVLAVAPAAALLCVALLLGVYMPPFLSAALRHAASALGGLP